MNSPPQSVDATSEPPQKPLKPNETLPPVQPPSSAFILQLFLIPLIIVSIIVCVWLMFSWLAHMGNDPQKLVQDIRKMNSASWQKALVLANMLRNEEYDHLKDDPQLASELSDLLLLQLQEGGDDDRSIKLRRFLCRAVGEFRRPEVLPSLLVAAEQEENLRDLEVRRSALAAIAILSSNLGPAKMRDNDKALEVLMKASRERSDGGADKLDRDALRSTAAFALGVIGGETATDRLAQMTIDAEPDVRFNAAIGLARCGDARATKVLRQMLDPDNEQAVKNETSDGARERKRMDVMINAVRAIRKLKEQNPAWDHAELTEPLEALAANQKYPPAALEAKAALLSFDDVKK